MVAAAPTTRRSALGSHVRRVLGHTEAVSHLVAAPDGSSLAAAPERLSETFDGFDSDYTVRIWDPGSGELRHILTGDTDSVVHLVAASDGTWLATDGGDAVRIWDPVTGQLRRT